MSLVLKLYDLASNELADISDISLEKTWSPRLGQAATYTIQAPAGDSLLTSVAEDGYANLRDGNRKLVVWEDGTPIFHGRVVGVERNGDGNENLVTITAQTPVGSDLGYEGTDQAGRIVRGSTDQPTAGDPYGEYDGNFIQPKFASSVADQAGVSGPDLILQALTNSQNTGAESDPSPGEGPLPIDLTTGTFDLDVPPAVDLSSVDTMDWPVLIGDFIQQLVQTGVCDIYERPLDIGELEDAYLMVALSAVTAFGSDKSGTVHFDYWTGSRNASQCRLVDSLVTLDNKLYYYLGPRESNTEWKGNITPGSSGTTVDPTASRALYGGPHTDKGQFMSIRVLDSVGSESSSRPLYIALWNSEQGFRVEPRSMLYITAAEGSAALFDAPGDFDIGDLIAVNVGDEFGASLADVQRVYGYDKTWSRENVISIGGLITSADAE